jgi:hypothetical protein
MLSLKVKAEPFDQFAGLPDPTVPSVSTAKRKMKVPAEIKIESSSLGLDWGSSTSESPSISSEDSYVPPFKDDKNPEEEEDEKPLGLKVARDPGDDSPLGYLQ